MNPAIAAKNVFAAKKFSTEISVHSDIKNSDDKSANKTCEDCSVSS